MSSGDRCCGRAYIWVRGLMLVVVVAVVAVACGGGDRDRLVVLQADELLMVEPSSEVVPDPLEIGDSSDDASSAAQSNATSEQTPLASEAAPTAVAARAPAVATVTDLSGFAPLVVTVENPPCDGLSPGVVLDIVGGGFAAASTLTMRVEGYSDVERALTVDLDGVATDSFTIIDPVDRLGGVIVEFLGTDDAGDPVLRRSDLFLVGPDVWPCAVDDVATTTGEAVAIPVLDNDVAGGASLDLSTLEVTLAGIGAATPNIVTGELDYVPDPHFVGTDLIEYWVCGDFNQCSTARVVITVDPGCTITGTPGDDIIDGTPGDDVICGLGGNDLIDGLGGDDVIYGNAGVDWIVGGPGNDTIFGGPGDDLLGGGPGEDIIHGGPGND